MLLSSSPPHYLPSPRYSEALRRCLVGFHFVAFGSDNRGKRSRILTQWRDGAKVLRKKRLKPGYVEVGTQIQRFGHGGEGV